MYADGDLSDSSGLVKPTRIPRAAGRSTSGSAPALATTAQNDQLLLEQEILRDPARTPPEPS